MHKSSLIFNKQDAKPMTKKQQKKSLEYFGDSKIVSTFATANEKNTLRKQSQGKAGN